MPIDKSELRRVIGHFATGVTVITTRDAEGKHFGLTANAVTSLSLTPPLLLICVDKAVDCFHCFEQSKTFTVNILSEGQESISRRFATKGIEKFDGIGYRVGGNGCAVLDEGVAHLECKVVNTVDGGDHVIHFGEVESADAAEIPPLMFFRGGYRKLAT